MKFVTSDYVVDSTTHVNLGFRGSYDSVPHSNEIYTPVSIFSFYIFMSLLICTGRTVDRMNIVNGS